jgi:8-oxo-dGTP pyrophosphatase MutT (NUDIX family)
VVLIQHLATTLHEPLHVLALTEGQPFTAGAVILDDGALLVTLNEDGVPEERLGALRIGGVGGGQEPGESIVECARREATEELGVAVDLLPAPRSFFHDVDAGSVVPLTCVDPIPPLLLERQATRDPTTPFRPDLPAGPYLYSGLFFAGMPPSIEAPGDDVQGLLLVPLDKWPLLDRDLTLMEALDSGMRLVGATRVDRLRRLLLPERESFRVVADLIARHPDVVPECVAFGSNATEVGGDQ